MGLFRNSLRSSAGSASTWATEASAFGSSSSHTISGDDDECALAHRVRQLEDQLLQRDETIARLNEMSSAEVRVNSQRIELLETQLERLVELSSSACAELGVRTREASLPNAREKGVTGSTNEEDPEERSSCSRASGGPQGGEGGDKGDMELSALTELLSRVLAEKDRLKLENDNLKSLLKQDDKSEAVGSSAADGCSMPSSIEELDRVVATRCGPKARCEGRPQDKCERDKAGDSRRRDDRGDKTKKTILYQLSCRECPELSSGGRNHLKYMGAFVSASGKDKGQLRTILIDHFTQVYEMAQGGAPSKNCMGGFLLSSLARRLAERGQSIPDKDDFLVWCLTNVKVEIKKRALDADEMERHGIEFNDEKIAPPPPREKSRKDKSKKEKGAERSKTKKHSKGTVGKGHSRRAEKLLRRNVD